MLRQPKPRLTPRGARVGFTLPEILIVIVMISVLALVAIPRFATANGKRHMESARMRVAAALATARQAAIQKGQTVRFEIKSHRVKVYVVSGSGTRSDTLVSPAPLDTLYKVKTGADVTIDYTARGFTTAQTTYNIKLSRAGVADDSVFVTSTGMVKR